MERKFKGLVAINDVLDERYQKLSDKYHALELSHNRKKKCLSWIRAQFTPPKPSTGAVISGVTIGIEQVMILLKHIDDALFSDGRDRQPYTKRKKNG